MTLKEILAGIEEAQTMQDRDGPLNPGKTFAFTFPVTFAQRLYLRAIRSPVEFVELKRSGQRIGIMGCFKPRPSHAGI